MPSINRVNREHLRDFLSVNKRREIIAKSVRDVSHIKDKRSGIKKLPDLGELKLATQLLPISTDHLKKIVNSAEVMGAPSPRGLIHLICTKEKCLEKAINDDSF